MTATAAKGVTLANDAAEEHVLGSMFLSPKAIAAAEGVLGNGAAFYRDSNRKVYLAALSLHAAGKPVDPVTVVDWLQRNGDGHAAERVHELAIQATASANVAHHAGIVVDVWRRRQAWLALLEAQQMVSGSASGDEAVRAVEAAAEKLRTVDAPRESVVSFAEAAVWFGELMENPLEAAGGVAAPFSFLPRLQPGRLYVLSGYEKDGKTVLAEQFTIAASQPNGFVDPATGQQRRAKVGVASLEMNWQDLFRRIVSTYGVPWRQTETGRVLGLARDRAREAVLEAAQWTGEIIDDPVITPEGIGRRQRLGGYDLLVIDHLHRFSYDHSRETAELSRIVQQLTNVARLHNVPVLLLAQLSRASSGTSNPYPMPTPAQLRGSGMIEKEAAAIFFVYRKRDPETHLRSAESLFIVTNNRYGRDRVEDIVFDADRIRFVEPAKEAA